MKDLTIYLIGLGVVILFLIGAWVVGKEHCKQVTWYAFGNQVTLEECK